MVATTFSAASCKSSSEQREDDRGQPAWAEPADERDAETVEAGAEERQCDRQHPDHGEAEHRRPEPPPFQLNSGSLYLAQKA